MDDKSSPQRITAMDRRNSVEDKAVKDIERQEKRSTLPTNDDYEVPYDPPKKKHRFLRKLAAFFGWILLIVLLTAAGGGAAWHFWLKDEPKQKADTSQQTPPPAPPAAEETPTESYTSTPFLLQFNYPEGWKVSEGSDNKLVAISPVMQLKTVDVGKRNGQVVFTIQHKQASMIDFKGGSALSIRESEKIDYKKPSQTQRASTYISFLNYASSISKGVDGIYVTGDNGYIKGQYVPQADVAKSDPLITLTFRSCPDTKCTTPGNGLTLAASNWDDKTFVTPLRAMLQSIIVQ